MRTFLRRQVPIRIAFLDPPDPNSEENSGGSGGGAGGSGSDADQKAGQDAERGFPASTPVADMTAEQQAAYWKFHARKHEDRVRELGDLSDLREKARKWDEHAAASASEQDKAVQAAVAAATASQTAAHRAELAEFALRGALGATQLTDEQRAAVLKPLDFAKFVGADGRPDENAIAAFVATVGGAAAAPGGGHGGHRPPGKGGSMTSGVDRYREQHPQK